LLAEPSLEVGGAQDHVADARTAGAERHLYDGVPCYPLFGSVSRIVVGSVPV
jgi:hypothetical protein